MNTYIGSNTMISSFSSKLFLNVSKVPSSKFYGISEFKTQTRINLILKIFQIPIVHTHLKIITRVKKKQYNLG